MDNEILNNAQQCSCSHHPENDAQYAGLTVNAGIEQPPSINPYLKRRKRRQLSVNDYVEGILKGDTAVLGQAVTLIESVAPEHQSMAQEVIERCLPHAGRSRRIGITGVPGAGKSTSIDVFGIHVLRRGGKLAVLAIDPSSERSKGSILGDKTRMEKLAVHPRAFIRPSPSAGSLGGVARKTRETIVLCEAAGYDTVFVETVGVGQSETAVHSMVDYFLLIQLAGTGDELQGIKRGIMEMADGIVINKADGDNVDRANLAAAQFRNALHLFPMPPSGVVPEVIPYSGYYELNIDAVWDMIDRYFAAVDENGYFEQRRRWQERYWMRATIDEQLRARFYNNPEVAALLEQKEREVMHARQSSFNAAADVLNFYFNVTGRPKGGYICNPQRRSEPASAGAGGGETGLRE
ncbi:MAG: methylmalonyl Co-A mutase-associated GTPase MeaB [Muribaculaceae bacterium]|nr:methylmalonyl Co-A mutase-associated GTPase MeaB [Muribaculaceae bacterium]